MQTQLPPPSAPHVSHDQGFARARGLVYPELAIVSNRRRINITLTPEVYALVSEAANSSGMGTSLYAALLVEQGARAKWLVGYQMVPDGTRVVPDGTHTYHTLESKTAEKRVGKDLALRRSILLSSSLSSLQKADPDPEGDALAVALAYWAEADPFCVLDVAKRATLITTLTEAYPLVDVIAESKRLAVWWEANPDKRKTKRGTPRFINGWFARVKQSTMQFGEPSLRRINKTEADQRHQQWLDGPAWDGEGTEAHFLSWLAETHGERR